MNWKIVAFAAPVVAFAAGLAVAQTAGTNREPQFDNAQANVWKTVVFPHDPLPFHRHEHPRVIIALSGGTTQFAEQAAPGKTTFGRPAMPVGCPATRPGQCASMPMWATNRSP